MMMAPDSGPTPPRPLTPETIDRVATALSNYAADPRIDGEILRQALRAMAVEARDVRMPPEQLLVVLKDLWHTLPAVRAAEHPEAQARLLQRVVTMCIKEYYA
jgi:hypothetical protein